ncbi:hypothetical protein WJ978_25185 [Achromobacter xylosoxidans]
MTAYGARRPADALVAVYPHCFEGRRAHYASTFRFWGIVVAAVFLFMMCLDAILSMFKGTFSLTGQLSAYAVYLAYGLPALLLVLIPGLAGRSQDGGVCADGGAYFYRLWLEERQRHQFAQDVQGAASRR